MTTEQFSAGWKKVCIGVDGSAGSLRAVEYVGRLLGQMQGVAVTLVCVEPRTQAFADIGGQTQEASAGPQRVFDAATAILEKSGIDPAAVKQVPCRGGDIAACIVRAARETGSGTIVIGRRGASKVRELVLGSAAEQVMRRTERRVLWVVD